jgi:DeoR family transcriptional regulator, ulaG and ulaABCDEF operon transcriptional repressor
LRLDRITTLSMHAAEREKIILELLQQRNFIAFRDLEKRVDASPATLRRDLERMHGEGLIQRVRGGAKLADGSEANGFPAQLSGVPFHENIHKSRRQKEAIGRAAAALCDAGTAIMIDGGSTTLQICPHIKGLDLQVLTNSLHIVSALLTQTGTRVLVPGGSVFREQNIILSAAGDDLMPRFHAPKLFMGAAAVGIKGVMQADVVLVAAERRLIERAEEVILVVDSSKFHGSSGNVVCELREVDVVVTDSGISQASVSMLEAAGIKVMVAD